MNLYPYQIEGIEKIRQAFGRVKRVIYVLPTSGGKTVIMSHIALGSVRRGRRVLILVHRVELLKQTGHKLSAFGVPHWFISTEHTQDDTFPVQIAMVATIRNRQTEPFDLIIVDECHHTPSSTYQEVISRHPNAYVLGVTATPCRLDGKGLADCFDEMVQGPQIYDLIDFGSLSKPVTFAPATAVDLKGIKTVAGDYVKSELSEAMSKPSVTGSAIKEYMKHAPGRPCVVFCVSVKHAQQVAQDFTNAGFRAVAVDGSTDREERAQMIAGLSDGSVQVLCSCDIISEGTDVPAIEVGISLRPTKSLSLYIQQMGRVLRKHPGKDRALLLDHAGNCHRHGLITSHRDWALEPGKEAKRTESIIRQCLKCYAVYESARTECPECGTVPPPKPREVVKIAGELVPVEEAERAKDEARKELWGRKSMDEWVAIARKRGYKVGWARFRFEAQEAKYATKTRGEIIDAGTVGDGTVWVAFKGDPSAEQIIERARLEAPVKGVLVGRMNNLITVI
jgi:superfamily II DNA or RNA helicase